MDLCRAGCWLLILPVAILLETNASLAAAAEPGGDTHSRSNPSQVRVGHVDLDLTVDFDAKKLKGSATLDIVRAPNASDAPLILDTKGLIIHAVKSQKEDAKSEWVPLTFQLGGDDKYLGSALEVKLTEGVKKVRLDYETTDKATALQWLDAKGTAGGKFPFLFTQSEAILARTWIPIQDTPGNRLTYSATIHVAKGLTAVMSADRLDMKEAADGSRTYRFDMPQAIPSYLIALAVGELEFRSLGSRTGVFAEPSVVDKAASEFADTQDMVETIEKRFGPYRWGRYDLLVLPPSFPFGGMENPKLTFATPTVIAGDRSLVSLVAHELAHSWSGNLVTNATWRDFWLNEGFTTYLERRAMEDLYGKERAAMEGALGLRELKKELAEFDPRDQILHLDLKDRDPDEGMTRVAYEKGALFLTTLEKAFGRKTFDAFLKGYFDHFGFQSITTEQFAAYLQENLLDKNKAVAKTLPISEWLEKPGLPVGAPDIKSPKFALVEAAARQFSTGKTSATQLLTTTWTTQEWLHFLRSLPDKLTNEQMTELDKAFGLTQRGNSEIAAQWLVLSIRNDYAPAKERLESFLTTIGRRKFLMPLYGELIKTSKGRQTANTIFEKASSFYHPISRESVSKLLAKPQ